MKAKKTEEDEAQNAMQAAHAEKVTAEIEAKDKAAKEAEPKTAPPVLLTEKVGTKTVKLGGKAPPNQVNEPVSKTHAKTHTKKA